MIIEKYFEAIGATVLLLSGTWKSYALPYGFVNQCLFFRLLTWDRRADREVVTRTPIPRRFSHEYVEKIDSTGNTKEKGRKSFWSFE